MVAVLYGTVLQNVSLRSRKCVRAGDNPATVVSTTDLKLVDVHKTRD